MRRGIKIGSIILAADAPAPQDEEALVETSAEDMEDDALEDRIIELITQIYQNKTKIKKRGKFAIKKYGLALTTASTVKDVLEALALVK